MGKDPFPPLDFGLAIRRLKKDLRDEWFPDPLDYGDLLSAPNIRKHFSQAQNTMSGQPSELFNLPKPSFTLRYSLETSIYDRVLYQAIIDKLIEKYDPLLSPRVASHRLSTRDRRYMFHNGVEAWKAHLQAVQAELERTSSVLLVTDIQNYFECISIAELEASLQRADAANLPHFSRYIDILVNLLHKWSPYKDVGIPQNRDPSSFLGNIYLRDVDEEMLGRGYNYFRYMDDIKIVCEDKYQARRALKDLVISLRHKRLNVNSRKTKILAQGADEIREVLPPPNRSIEEIEALWQARRLGTIRESLPRLREYTNVLIREGRTDSREFRFCVGRLGKIARCPAFNFDFTGVVQPVIDLLTSQPWAADMVIRLLSSLRLEDEHLEEIIAFLTDPVRNIYEWQGYRLWQLVTMAVKQRKSSPPALRRLAKQTLSQVWDPPMKAGAILYLGACGTKNDRLFVLRNALGINSRFVLRAVVVATLDCPKADLDKYLFPCLAEEDAEVSRQLQTSKLRRSYFEPPPPLRAQELYDDLPSTYGF